VADKSYTLWKGTKTGLLFKNAEGNKFLACDAKAASSTKRLVSFQCSSVKDPSDEVAPTFWNKCSGAAPAGWNQQWGPFDYPFYAIAPNGFYGCSELTTDGYCIDPYYYSTGDYNPDDMASVSAVPATPQFRTMMYSVEVASVAVKAAKTGSLELQQHNRWSSLEGRSFVADKSYTLWKGTKTGLLFKNAEGNKFLACDAKAASSTKRLVSFQCSSVKDPSDEVAPTFWNKCSGAAPAGWNQQWGPFDYPFYAIAPNGFYGCSELTTDGYCIDPYYYSTGDYNPDDLQ